MFVARSVLGHIVLVLSLLLVVERSKSKKVKHLSGYQVRMICLVFLGLCAIIVGGLRSPSFRTPTGACPVLRVVE